MVQNYSKNQIAWKNAVKCCEILKVGVLICNKQMNHKMNKVVRRNQCIHFKRFYYLFSMVIGTYKNKVVLMECMIMHKNNCFKESCTLKIIIYLYQSASTIQGNTSLSKWNFRHFTDRYLQKHRYFAVNFAKFLRIRFL